MHSRLLLTALFLGLIALVSASAIPIQKRGSFKVERRANPNFTGNDGLKAMGKAYRKFGWTMPQELKDALAVREAAVAGGNGTQIGGNGTQTAPAAPAATQPASGQVGSVTNTPEGNDVEFLSPVKIGGQTLNLDFDTGSSDLWVFNTAMDPSLTAGHILYDPTKSKTFKQIQGAQFLVQYGDGSGAEGVVGTDVVDVGGAVFDAQAVEIATAVTQQFVDDQQNDGLMGLAFSTLNTVQPQQQKTFLDNVQSSLAEPVFTADLKKGQPGTYTFGAVDATAFQGDLTWVDVDNSQGFWQFSSESFAVNGGATQQATAGGQAIADTGTTLLLADPIIVQGYYSQVQGAQNDAQAGGFTIPCDAQLPDLDLDVGGKYVARISGSDLNFSPVSGNTCFGGLQATTQGGLGVYGDIFFKSQFVAFNIGNNTLGLAPHA
ncbi:acid protease [Trichoderma citrinoviride]|uniref:Acid protease n=1 Tax=Trichoderma citrinoviride TaxID=58853 RepID=A0A2T4B8L2_9HYPO|nr:acid protease [Trichoderma citrinoviride]PTB65673.1 acid protease [Trichoderma citrinoviride]